MLSVAVLEEGKAAAEHDNAPLTLLRFVAPGTLHAVTDPVRWPLVLLCPVVSSAASREGDQIIRTGRTYRRRWTHLLVAGRSDETSSVHYLRRSLVAKQLDRDFSIETTKPGRSPGLVVL